VRDYAKVSPTFWTGPTGLFLRQCGREAQLLALYLITGPSANMIGLYHLPIPLLCHHTGLSHEGALKALGRASEGGFCHYDEATEVVWVPEMACYQIGPTLAREDNRVKGIARELLQFRKSRFFNEFMRRYGEAYHLADRPELKPLASPSGGACKPLRSQEQEQEQEILSGASCRPGPDDEQATKRTKQKPRAPRPRDELFDAIAAVTGFDAKTSGAHIGKVAAKLREADPPYTPAEVRSLPAVIKARGLEFAITPGVVEKYIGWTRNQPSTTNGQPPETLEQYATRMKAERDEDERRRAQARAAPSIRAVAPDAEGPS
jgi:hypothetical protein